MGADRAVDHSPGLVHLRGARSDAVIDTSSGVPVIIHWGAQLGGIDPTTVLSATAVAPPGGGLERVAPLSLFPEHGSGFPGRPGLSGSRPEGRDWSPRFVAEAVAEIEHGLQVSALDSVAGLRLETSITLGEVLIVRAALHNRGTTRYQLERLDPTVALPEAAAELMTFHGRWAGEFQRRRQPWAIGSMLAENRSGRTSHEFPPLIVGGTAGFGEWSGEVWELHLAWSGNHTVLATRLPDGRRFIQLGELLHPGEIVLAPGESYTTPEVIGSYSAGGLTPASWGMHRLVRSRPGRPTAPRPVLLNTWEATYFDHRIDRLRALATAAADVGIERFVLDDGWFGGRRDDRRGLGDWDVSIEVYPQGLAPLIEHVRGLGMTFGIWVEPEMVNPDSELYRAHPEWVLATDGYAPVLGRHELVLDLANPAAFAHILGKLDTLLGHHDIAFVKWDMNRPHVQASGVTGAPGSHAQTLAFYALVDELRRRHPSVEFESCASGGGRIDLEVLRRAERVWTSDCNDALERQEIQRGASMLVPPDVMGAHIGASPAHTTGRAHSMGFRALTALFGHLGVEADITAMDAGERATLAEAIAVYKRFRPLLHGGDAVRFDPFGGDGEPSWLAHGVYAADRTEALVACVALQPGASQPPPLLQLPGLTAEARYGLRQVALGRGPRLPADGIELSGRQLATHGVRLPWLHPESGILIHLTAR